MLQLLANELIFEILRHFLPGLRLSVTKRHRFPWYLGGICNAWRTVFISSPQFWTVLHICVDAVDDFSQALLLNQDHLFDLIQLALKRSGGHPLTLSIAMHNIFYQHTPPALQILSKNILEMLVTHSVYWRDVNLMMPSSLCSVLRKAKGRLPVLRSMTFSTDGSRQAFESANIYDLFMGAEQLTRINIYYISDWKINWSCIAVIHMRPSYTSDEIISLLWQTSVLKELVIHHICNTVMVDGTSPVQCVHLPFLKVLYIPKLRHLPLFHAPGLEELCIRNTQPQSEPDDLQSLKTIVSSCFSTIHCLRKLAMYPYNMRDALLILEETPNTTQHLLLHGGSISEQLGFVAKHPPLWNLKAITIATYDHEILPLLATVRTWVQRKQVVTDSSIGPFKNLVQFSLVFVTWQRRETFKSVERLKRVLEEQGIEFESKTIKRPRNIADTLEPPF